MQIAALVSGLKNCMPLALMAKVQRSRGLTGVVASTRATPSPETVAASVPESVSPWPRNPAGFDGEVLHQLCAERLNQVGVPG